MTTFASRSSAVCAFVFFLAAAAASILQGCVPVIVAGAAGATMVAVDRRSTVAQADDGAVELKVESEAGTRWGNEIHLNVTSYNGNVLVTGESPNAEVKSEIARMARGASDRVRNVYDEMVIGPVTDLGARSNDSYITSKVKARMLDSDAVKTIYVKVVTERSVVYLMGIVSRSEGDRAAQVAATTDGVARVVKVFEYTN
ncbi:MAG TPA: BON domain-containing protein [Casimicrobiaceae bacterium]|nr:BON domain-containing protein [Casimicrobiaceae bacterium]